MAFQKLKIAQEKNKQTKKTHTVHAILEAMDHPQ